MKQQNNHMLLNQHHQFHCHRKFRKKRRQDCSTKMQLSSSSLTTITASSSQPLKTQHLKMISTSISQECRRRRRKSFPSIAILSSILLLIAIIFKSQETSCDFVCRKDNTDQQQQNQHQNNPNDQNNIFPCSCQNGSGGLQITCSRSNLALLSQTLKLIDQPIERLEISDSMISRLFGPILTNSNHYESLHSGALRELIIRSSNLRQIDEFASFQSGSLTQSLESLNLNGNKLTFLPSEQAFQNLTNLRLLNLSNNSISQLESSSSPTTVSGQQTSFSQQMQSTNNNNHNNLAITAITFTATNNSTQNATNNSSSSSSCLTKLVNLTELDLSLNKLTRITRNDFLQLVSLELLNLRGNELVKLEKNCLVACGRKLRQLDLSQNKLSALDRQDFTELTQLEWLSLAQNQLTTLPRSIFTRNVKLYTLDLSGNKLDDLDTYLFKSVRFLRRLNISSNSIRELGKNVFASTNRIKSLDLAQNLIQLIGPESFKGLDYLEKIDLSHNSIVNISSEAFSKLTSLDLDLSHNKLTRINSFAFHEIANFTRLNLSHNALNLDSIMSQAFEKVDCNELDLSHNFIEDLSRLPVSNFTSIRRLDVSHNQLTELNKKSFSQRGPLNELQWLDASYNDISQITGNILADKLRSLRQLKLSHNSLRRLTGNAFGQSTTLVELDLSHNNLVELVQGTLSNLFALKRLDLRYNRLKKMIQIPSALTHLSLQFNEISQIHLQLQSQATNQGNSNFQQQQQQQQQHQHSQLQELELDHNRISQIDNKLSSQSLFLLKNLSLSNNNLSFVPTLALQDLISLRRLNLSANIIKKIAPRTFQNLNLNSLIELDLSQNNLSQIGDFAFDGLAQLDWLSLEANALRELAPYSFAPSLQKSLRNLNLQSNFLKTLGSNGAGADSSINGNLNSLDHHHNKQMQQVQQQHRQLTSSNQQNLIWKNRSPLEDLESLEVIQLAKNRLSSLSWRSFKNNVQLRELDLSLNQLQRIETGYFSHLPSLERLILSNNLISDIEPLVLGNGTQSLKLIDLSWNKLTYLREGTLGSLNKQSTPLFNSLQLKGNKLNHLDGWTIAEIDAISSLESLNLAQNKLSSFQSDFVRWIKRGTLVDLRNQQHDQSVASSSSSPSNQYQQQPETLTNTNSPINEPAFECACELLPFVSWLEGVRARNLTYWVLGSEANIMQQQQQQHHQQNQQQQDEGESSSSSSYGRRNDATTYDEQKTDQQIIASRNHLIKLVQQYGQSASLMANVTCQRPSLMRNRHLIDLTTLATRAEMNCDPITMMEADSYKRLRAPIQLNNAQFNPPNLKISWSLLDPQIEVSNFVIIRATFNQDPNLSAIRWNLASTAQAGLARLTVDRLNYERRSHIFLENPQSELLSSTSSLSSSSSSSMVSNSLMQEAANNNNFNLICVLYESSPLPTSGQDDELQDMRLSLLTQASRRLTTSGFRSITNVLDDLIADVDHVNCLDLKSLLKHKRDGSARLMMDTSAQGSGSSSTQVSFGHQLTLASILRHVIVLLSTVTIFAISCHR